MKLLEILVYFRDFCNENNLRFFLAAGTCIGAVRHQGFIPWDDDLDVQMFREDYEKLLKLWDEKADTSRFKCCTTTNKTCCRFPMTVIRSTDTTCIYNHSIKDDICQGLKIDVEFLDASPERKLDQAIHYLCSKLFGLFRAQRVPARASFPVKCISWLFLHLVPTMNLRWKITKLLEKRIKKFNSDPSCKYVRYLSRPPYEKTVFDDVLWVDFEGYKMPIPAGFDRQLTTRYGNYMELPPEKDRKPATDNLVFYDLDHSYLNYKGKYYCVK